MRALSCLLLGPLVLLGCGDNGGGPADAAAIDGAVADAMPVDGTPGPDANPLMPGTLAETGLCVDAACTEIASDVLAYTPSYILWSDGATKRRWIYLPPGSQIDTSDMDYWQFPVGTKLWKEFTRDGVRVETRLLQKNGPDPGDWYFAAFAWNEAQDEAVAVPFGVVDALGTDHDIPSRSDCRKCHDRLTSRALGFGAIQLDHDAVTGEIDLADLIADGALSAPPAGAAPYFPLPGDATTRAAFGYLHSNCGNCHNPTTDINTTDMDLRLRVGLLGSADAAPAWSTTVGVPNSLTLAGATARVEAGMPDHSAVYLRFTSTNDALRMPPIGHELIDPTGQQILLDWITAIP
ncbi:MAG: hypothetical protein KC464_11930 [Myxococcales bacterium]|nr:hypothetical protein [Myxococcales bacterium]